MIPTTNTAFNTNITFAVKPTLQHQMLLDSKRIIGKCDNLDAVKQAIYKILNTERYAYEIYSWQYGIELLDLIGEPPDYVIPEIERRVEEALMTDDRITAVDTFEFEQVGKNKILATFTVHTIYGTTTEEVTVNI